MKKYLLVLVYLVLLFGLGHKVSAAVPCTAEFNVAIRDPQGNKVVAQFSVYQEATDANGLRVAIKQLASAKVDAITGFGKIKFTASTNTENYVIKVINPSLKNRDFLFYDKIAATCGTVGEAEITLSTFRITVSDTFSNIIKNVAVTVNVQGTDASNKIVATEVLGIFNTGTLGRVDVFAPATERLNGQGFNFYLVSAKNTKGLIFDQQNITANDGGTKYIDIRLGDVVVMVKDSKTGQIVPNFKITVSDLSPSVYGGYTTNKQIETITTDDQGRAFIQLPIGIYYLSYTDSNGEKINTAVEIKENKRYESTVWLEDYKATACQYKSDLKLVFRDYKSQIIGNMNYNIYLQRLEPEGWPAPGAKVTSGSVDDFGLTSTKLNTTPAQKYLLEVCPQKTNGGCFWFPNIDFACSEKLTLEKTIPAVTIVLRDEFDVLLVGRKFKVYQQVKDVDGKVIIDRDLLLGIFTLNAPGKFDMYLPSKDLRGYDQNYIIVIEQSSKLIARANFYVPDDNVTLDYVVSPGKLTLRNGTPVVNPTPEPKPTPDKIVKPTPAKPTVVRPADKKLRGRILLQVESKGEAWYIHPVTGLKYYLGSATQAYQIMKKVSYGMSNRDLMKIEPVLDEVTGTDSDNDGLPDRLEEALETDRFKFDSDDDGYDDYEELTTGFNPNGIGMADYNHAFAVKQAGKILLQVEGNGEAWYVNPVNFKRYYLGQPADAYQLMRKLGLGATNASLDKIKIAK